VDSVSRKSQNWRTWIISVLVGEIVYEHEGGRPDRLDHKDVRGWPGNPWG